MGRRCAVAPSLSRTSASQCRGGSWVAVTRINLSVRSGSRCPAGKTWLKPSLVDPFAPRVTSVQVPPRTRIENAALILTLLFGIVWLTVGVVGLPEGQDLT